MMIRQRPFLCLRHGSTDLREVVPYERENDRPSEDYDGVVHRADTCRERGREQEQKGNEEHPRDGDRVDRQGLPTYVSHLV
jgi:hypothetical protein